MLGNFSASFLTVNLDDAALSECKAFLGEERGFSCKARIVVEDAERGAFFWPPEGNDGTTKLEEVLSAGRIPLKYPTYGPKPEAKEEGDGDEAAAVAEGEEAEASQGPFGDPERAKEFELSKDAMNDLLNCPLQVEIFAVVRVF